MFQTLKAFALLGGEWVLLILVGLSLWAGAVVWDRYFYFKGRSRRAEELEGKVPDLLAKGRAKETLAFLKGKDCPEARVLEAGLTNLSLGPEGLEQLMESRRLQERMAMERHLLVLGTLGNNIPFVGLFGTVLGIIKAFNELAVSGTSGPTVVMKGVAEALVSTALGLLIAIPIVAFFNYFQGGIKRSMANADRLARLVLAYSKKLK